MTGGWHSSTARWYGHRRHCPHDCVGQQHAHRLNPNTRAMRGLACTCDSLAGYDAPLSVAGTTLYLAQLAQSIHDLHQLGDSITVFITPLPFFSKWFSFSAQNCDLKCDFAPSALSGAGCSKIRLEPRL